MAVLLVLLSEVTWTFCPVVLSLGDVNTTISALTTVGAPFTCPGLWFIPTFNGTCHCGVSVHNVVLCSELTQRVHVIHCYCLTPDSVSDQMVIGTCIYTCASHTLAPTNCSTMNRKGTLCGDCDKDAHAFPLAYSYDMECMKCPRPDSWWKAFLPLTAFIVIVLVCRISVIHPKLRVFVFFLS